MAHDVPIQMQTFRSSTMRRLTIAAVWAGFILVAAGAYRVMPALAAGAPGATSFTPTADGLRTTLPESKYTDVSGATVTLGHSQPAAMAFVFINTECPISNKLVPELNRLAKLASDKK